MAIGVFYAKSEESELLSPGMFATTYTYWDYSGKSVASAPPLPSTNDASYKAEKDLLIDCYQNGTAIRFVYAKGDGMDSATYSIVDEPNKILLKVELSNSVSAEGNRKRTIYVYNKNTRAIESRFVECIKGFDPLYQYESTIYFIKENGIIDTYCLGTTKREIYFSGPGIPPAGVSVKYGGGVSTYNLDYNNSADCGFLPPEDGAILIKEIFIKIDRSCYKNKVYLKWKNALGGYDQWLFHTTQAEQLKTGELGIFDLPVTYLDAVGTNRRSRGKAGERSLVLGADNLAENEYKTIRALALSPEVLVVDKDNNKIEVNVEPGSFTADTKESRYSITFQINYPGIYTQNN